ncbi:hypothetical protein CEUSTIGMA_g9205.t1 [Chlamydomonas eustigma]|uniref:EF-hand domain-containing protein n=1 Tax=Chlamydomonas eustigma TaxID=1157962 RepID=A0A250XFC8_9CHLO|nr:hypothetical protein CEUSTIGMA_g9205.t1 [Chlamydomonas eustigma]|eukprot:GAX81777.1 hypothetical protein CEUSTIGMA_g9205.t1 [Chlamydomonas eustigma]
MSSLTAASVRDVDKLLALPDSKIAQLDKDYLDKHGIELLFNNLLVDLVTLKPLDPIQYIIDSIQYGQEYSKQDPKTGLPEYRKDSLVCIFNHLDKAKLGRISFKGLERFASKFGGETLGQEELHSIFKDFNPHSDNLIDLDQFLLFFAKVSRTITNYNFEELVKNMLV